MVHVSVVIPTYNRPENTERAIRSVFAQDIADFEILIADDGSSPPFHLPDDLAARGLCRVLRHDVNRGPAAARNLAMGVAQGTWIAFLDSDDEWIPNTLRSRLAAAEADFTQRRNPLAIHGCAWQDVSRNGVHLRTRHPRPSRSVSDFLTGCWYAPGSTALFLREPVWAAVGGQDERLKRLEDFDWFLRLALAGAVFVAQAIVGARIQAGTKAPAEELERNIATLLSKWSEDQYRAMLPPRSFHLLRAYLDLERASSAWFSDRKLMAVIWLSRSLLMAPRARLHPSPGWSIE
jgi:glycosyltransferase involved in cell wall biosynthesis